MSHRNRDPNFSRDFHVTSSPGGKTINSMSLHSLPLNSSKTAEYCSTGIISRHFVIAKLGYGERFKRDQTELTDSLSVETIEASGGNVNTRLEGWRALHLSEFLFSLW
ncbi:hypothetical protein AVEN_16128-1 [Araneus ventricosus]|uniref:Uncharacterized protein n=1 Tax=Araneus ventricosus TaxID=182803 RepID=A0A4Y2UG36_ARAVE|nr:hypothetical protein AVEN_180975-1 [Araneus ventricosus]GBO11052.1 hypothetical protein AVEN_16128-1 [Araneus ventricosus]